jgi:microcystin-dependent protein
MATPFIGEIRLFSFGFAPRGWAQCNGQLLPINGNQALFSILGTTYGGNGTTNFAVPDLRGRMALHAGPTIGLGTRGGVEAVTLLASQLPAHTHALQSSTDFANAAVPGDALPAAKPRGGIDAYVSSAGSPLAPLNPAALAASGGSQPHENRQPFNTLNMCIATVGLFPPRN